MTHECNELCGKLGLPIATASDGAGLAAPNNTATSAIEIIRSKHLQQRKREREIETRDMQAAIKHGRKQAGTGNGTVKHTHNGVAVVTDASYKVGVSTFPTDH